MAFTFAVYSSGTGSAMTDAQWGEFAKALLGTGVIKGALIAGSAGNDLAVTAPGTGMTVNLGTGQAMVYGHWCQNDASAAQTITTADPTNPRIDRVVLKHDVTAKTVSVVVKAGTPAPSPTAPGLTQTPSTWEMSLCQIAVGAGVTSISSGNVTDERVYASATLAGHAASEFALLAGAAFSGGVSAQSLTANTLGITISAANQGVELGAKNAANTPFVDFNSSGFGNDYDTRLVATSGANGTSGAGTLNIQTANLQHNGNKIWDIGNDGPGSGLDADSVDGIQGAAIALLAGATFTGTVNVSSGSLQQGGKNAVFAQVGLTGKFSAQTTAPTSPADGDLWLDTSTVLA